MEGKRDGGVEEGKEEEREREISVMPGVEIGRASCRERV